MRRATNVVRALVAVVLVAGLILAVGAVA